MTVIAAAVCPATPLLCPDVAVSANELGAVQGASHAAVGALVAAQPDEVVVVGEAPRTEELTGTWDWGGFGLAHRAPPGRRLPRALGIAAWLLDEAGWRGRRRYLGIATTTSPAACDATGEQLRLDPAPTALLVVADGSARRTLKAPGYLDPRAEPYDDAIAAALASADGPALRHLDAALAAELLAAGRAPLQVLAGAATGYPWTAQLLLHEAPYGVGWFVATWQRNDPKTF